MHDRGDGNQFQADGSRQAPTRVAGNGTAKGGLRETSEIDLWYRRSVDIGDFYVVEALSAEALHRSHGLSSRPAFDDNSGAVAGVFRLDKHNCHSTITKPAFGLPM